MKTLFFPKLALSGIKNNRKIYIPYILSCIGIVMMFFIIHALSLPKTLADMSGGSNMTLILSLGKYVVAVFGLIFLFYTNSFVVRRRYREFGLYSILGIDKRGLCKIVFWESLVTAIIGLVGGIFLGMTFFKLAQLGLINAVNTKVDYSLSLPFEALPMTLAIFGAIFVLLMIKSVIFVCKLKPLDLLKSENYGEKPPKANWVIALLGAGLLGYAYYLAVTIKNPLSAFLLFFFAVIMVIAGTYALFISGSVALCRLMQKSKKYYYNKKHFVTVSQMAYRMKRNGAGLASVCILSTMVLVIVSSTSSLYFGMNESINSRYPNDDCYDVYFSDCQSANEEQYAKIRNCIKDAVVESGETPTNYSEYGYASIVGLLDGTRLEPDPANAVYQTISVYENIVSVFFMTADDYNAQMGTDIHPVGNETYYYTLRFDYTEDSVDIGGTSFKLTKRLDAFPEVIDANTVINPSLMIVVDDIEKLTSIGSLKDQNGEMMLSIQRYFGYDLSSKSSDTVSVHNSVCKALESTGIINGPAVYSYLSGCRELEKTDFFTTFGGLFFIGIILSAVFIFAAAMIIYYKQISEGYEDSAKFAVMQKVGMTKQDIKKSIDSQILVVFFAPLLLAGVHLCFAFPMLWKMLMLFNLQNMNFVIGVTVGAFALFALIYLVIYKITAKAYYSIVS